MQIVEAVICNQKVLAGKLKTTDQQHELIIAKLFSGRYTNAMQEVKDYKKVAQKILNRALN